MSYYRRMQASINYIDSNLTGELKIRDIASSADFSPYHFQRIFQAMLGCSVMQYIRLRRLSEAASELLSGDRRILEIAVKYQYGSQEAFTRAFKSCYGAAPAEFRKTGNSDFDRHNKADFMKTRPDPAFLENFGKPEITERGPFRIVGKTYETSLENRRYFDEIPGFYYDFGSSELFSRIPGRINPARSYGVVIKNSDDDSFGFLIGEESDPSAPLTDPQLSGITVDAGRWAVFRLCGGLDTIRNAWRYIYGGWLPGTNYELRSAPDFELTDVPASDFPDGLKMSIHIPIE